MASPWPRLLPLLACLYLPFIGGGLVTDDFAHIIHLSNLDSRTRLIDGPDAFGFYRPVTQASLALTPGLRASHPAQARAFNVVVHTLVIALAFGVARLVLPSPLAAGLATLAFALTPKAPPIAVLWISARGDLLMALFALASIAAWIRWTRHGGTWWLAASLAAYAVALLSKETATLLPLLLLLTPQSERSLPARAGAVTGFIAVGLVIYAWRSQVGALTPFSGDEHYNATISLTLWARGAVNYAGRMLAAPLGLIALLGVARLTAASFQRRAEPSGSANTDGDAASVIVFAAAFVMAFLAPALPIKLRSELYLYLPVFGVCLLAGWLAARLFSHLDRRPLMVAVGIYIVALGGYQFARAQDMQRNLVFSEQLVAALRSNAVLASTNGSVQLVPADGLTERLLRNTISGYFYLALPLALPGTPRDGSIAYTGEPPRQADLRLVCAYRPRDGTVVISAAP